MAPIIFKAPNFSMSSTTAPNLVSATGRERSPEIQRRASKAPINNNLKIKAPFDARKHSMSPALVRRDQTLFSNRVKVIALSFLTVAIALTAGILAVKFSKGSGTKASTVWHPKTGATWQLDLSTPLTNASVNADVYVIDLFSNNATTVSNLHAMGRKVICYFSAGTYDATLPDHASFHAADVRDVVDSSIRISSNEERWIDTRSASVRAAMLARIDLAVQNGCDGVDPGYTDSYTSTTGFDLSKSTALSYLQFLHNGAEARKISIGLRDTGALVDEVVSFMGWSINAGCETRWDCALFWPFIGAGKAVFHWVYVDTSEAELTEVGKTDFWCRGSNTDSFSIILKSGQDDQWVERC